MIYRDDNDDDDDGNDYAQVELSGVASFQDNTSLFALCSII